MNGTGRVKRPAPFKGAGKAGFALAPHTADIIVKASASGYRPLFRRAARGLLAVFGAKAAAGKTCEVRLNLQSPDLDALLGAWLNETAYLVSSGKIIPSKINIEELCLNRDGAKLMASLRGIKPSGLSFRREVKGVPLHGLAIKRGKNGLSVWFIADI
ncbi:MAG: archease [Elusimicrobia bacterium]|nr:archease [Elusimicrobiota bacterium]